MYGIGQVLLEKYQIRKSKGQKAAFREYVHSLAAENGYACREEKGYFGARNLVVGDPDTAKVVFCAHYDTCAKLPLPNFITPTRFDIYLVYQMALAVLVFALPMILAAVLTTLVLLPFGVSGEMMGSAAFLMSYVALLAACVLIIAGPANPHTANDNTSGVATVLELMLAMPLEYREKTAFVLFDLEEAGLLGSMRFGSRHKKHMKDTLVVNFDCVSDGDNMLFALRPGAKSYRELLVSAYPAVEPYTVFVLAKGVFYPSDQANFRCGVGVASLKRTKRGNILYMDKIHTGKDTVFQEENIVWLVDGSLRLTEQI